jgi:ATP adenylyltransferase/5',5'''-P-1,P-4-tetraphosphate phosphorylase II
MSYIPIKLLKKMSKKKNKEEKEEKKRKNEEEEEQEEEEVVGLMLVSLMETDSFHKFCIQVNVQTHSLLIVSIVRLCCRTSLQNFSNIPLIVLQEEDI